MWKMDDLHHSIGFKELRLKSKADFDFDAAYDVKMSSGLAAYTKRFFVFQPGDWPCQLLSSRNYPYSSHRRDWNFPGGGGFFETK